MQISMAMAMTLLIDTVVTRRVVITLSTIGTVNPMRDGLTNV
jgi:hypothetical protein